MPAIAVTAPTFSTRSEMVARYASAHAELWNSPLAKFDPGIDLRRGKPAAHVCIGDDEYAEFLAYLMRRQFNLELAGRKARIVCRAVTNHYDIEVDDLTSKRRFGHLIEPRHVAMFIMRRGFNYSTPQIGRALSRDHSTVLWAIRSVDQRMKADIAFRDKIAKLMRACGVHA